MKTTMLFWSVALAAAVAPSQFSRAEFPTSLAPASRDGVVLLSNYEAIRMPPYIVRPGVPVVTRLLEPRIPTSYIGQRLDLRLTVDAAGRPVDIGAVNVGSDLNLVTQLAAAISGWQFEPARDRDGNAYACAVILPVEIGTSDGLDHTERNPGGPVRLPAYYVRVNQDEPAPLHYIVPRIGLAYSGHSLTLRFVVDRKGRPYQIDSVGAADRNLVAQLAASVSGWEFDPARDTAGHPIERVMLLPVTIE